MRSSAGVATLLDMRRWAGGGGMQMHAFTCLAVRAVRQVLRPVPTSVYCYPFCRYEDYDAQKLVDCYLNLPQIKVGGSLGGYMWKPDCAPVALLVFCLGACHQPAPSPLGPHPPCPPSSATGGTGG